MNAKNKIRAIQEVPDGLFNHEKESNKSQFENCMKKEAASSAKAAKSNFIKTDENTFRLTEKGLQKMKEIKQNEEAKKLTKYDMKRWAELKLLDEKDFQ